MNIMELSLHLMLADVTTDHSGYLPHVTLVVVNMNHNILALFAYMHTCSSLLPLASLFLSFHTDLLCVLLHRAGRQGEVSLLLLTVVNRSIPCTCLLWCHPRVWVEEGGAYCAEWELFTVVWSNWSKIVHPRTIACVYNLFFPFSIVYIHILSDCMRITVSIAACRPALHCDMHTSIYGLYSCMLTSSALWCVY